MHTCRYPRWHRVLIGTGSLAWLYGSFLLPGLLWKPHPFVMLAGCLFTLVIVQVLQWRCRGGYQPSMGRAAQSALFLGSMALLGRVSDED